MRNSLDFYFSIHYHYAISNFDNKLYDSTEKKTIFQEILPAINNYENYQVFIDDFINK